MIFPLFFTVFRRHLSQSHSKVICLFQVLGKNFFPLPLLIRFIKKILSVTGIIIILIGITAVLDFVISINKVHGFSPGSQQLRIMEFFHLLFLAIHGIDQP